MPNIQHKRGTLAALDALASGNNLLPGQIYVVSDQNIIALALTVSTYQTYHPIIVSATEPADKTAGLIWIDTSA
ncbi:MAG: hypothetical protein AAGJ85_04380 [Pseudomonadota bacterium]